MAEIAGLVVGAVPLVVGIIKQYATLRSVCSRVRHHEDGLNELRRFLRRQQIIFTNETRLLLIPLVGKIQASAMINDPKHDGWTERETIKRIENALGELQADFKDSSLEVLQNIRSLGDEINRQESIGSRIKFGLSKSRIDGICSAIRESIEDYRTIRQQIHDLTNAKLVVEHPNETKRDVESTTNIQAAAEHVYKALTTACNLHTAHHAHMSLKPVCSNKGPSTRITFQMAYRHLAKQHISRKSDVHWFVIESVIENAIPQMIHPLTHVETTSVAKPKSVQPPKRSLSLVHDILPAAISPTSKRVRFRSPSPTKNTSEGGVVSEADKQALPAKCLDTDLCRQLMAAFQSNCPSHFCIGWLDNSPPWRHRIYPNCNPCSDLTISSPLDTQPLKDWLNLNAKIDLSTTSLPLERLRVAKILATAILNYHSTSWMKHSWRSSNILVYNTEHSQPFSSCEVEPKIFVEAPIDGDQQRLVASKALSFDIPLVRNSALFSLGVMMLELAFEKPLELMLKPCDYKHPAVSPAERDWHAALRLSKEVGTGLGIRYSRIVEQCLLCAFGHGTELSNPSLQDAVHRDVVTELDRLIEGFSQISLAALV